jgi:phosphoribosyl 1,2-cyclic phosphate phosphodiesterase
VLVTHSHADHIFGLDDVRRYNTLQGGEIPVYGSSETIADLKRIFNYVNENVPEPGVFRPQLDFIVVEKLFRVGSCKIEPLPVVHGKSATFGYRLEWGGYSVGYVPDCKEMPKATLERFKGVDVMILDGLRHRAHPTHLSVNDALALLKDIGARLSYLTHICHDLDHEETQSSLPHGVSLACDGMVISL